MGSALRLVRRIAGRRARPCPSPSSACPRPHCRWSGPQTAASWPDRAELPSASPSASRAASRSGRDRGGRLEDRRGTRRLRASVREFRLAATRDGHLRARSFEHHSGGRRSWTTRLAPLASLERASRSVPRPGRDDDRARAATATTATFAAAPPSKSPLIAASSIPPSSALRMRDEGARLLRLGLEVRGERAACPEDQRLDRGLRELQLVGDLVGTRAPATRGAGSRGAGSPACRSSASVRRIRSSDDSCGGAGRTSCTAAKSLGDSTRRDGASTSGVA